MISYRFNVKLPVSDQNDMVKEQIARLNRNIAILKRIDELMVEVRRLHQSVEKDH